MDRLASWSRKHNYIWYKLKTNEVIAGKQINIMKDGEKIQSSNKYERQSDR